MMANSPPPGRCTATAQRPHRNHRCRCACSPQHELRGQPTHLCPCGHEWAAA